MHDQTSQGIMARPEQSPLVTKALKRLGGQDWLSAWRKLAILTDGIRPEDSRLRPVLAALEACDEAFLADDWARFQQSAEQVRQAMYGGEHGG